MSDWRKYHAFNPFLEDQERRAAARGEDKKMEINFYKNRALRHDPDEQRRRIVHTNQLVRAKTRPPTLPKVWL